MGAMANPLFVVNVEVVVFQQDRYLMTHRSLQEEHAPGDLAFPGGKVESHEIMDDVLEQVGRREVLEEVGLEIGPMTYLESKAFMAGEVPCVDVVFLAPFVSGEVRVQDTELDGAFWMTYQEALLQPGLQPWTRSSLQKAEATRAI